jgi:predicted phosphodiesterase
MRVAVIADVHANLPALEAVLDVIEGCRPDRTICLGDIVGYNADPAGCVEALRDSAHVAVAGNHDVDVVGPESSAGTNPQARAVQEWTRRQLTPAAIDFLAGLPSIVNDPAGFVAVHGCFLNSTYYSGYVTSTMLGSNLAVIAGRADWPRLGLCGHTHVPMCGWLVGDEHVEPRFDGELRWPSNATAVLVNPGSVGQPRDGDPRAAFVLLDLEARSAELRRVRYDVERAIQAIGEAGLPRALGERLREGR